MNEQVGQVRFVLSSRNNTWCPGCFGGRTTLWRAGIQTCSQPCLPRLSFTYQCAVLYKNLGPLDYLALITGKPFSIVVYPMTP